MKRWLILATLAIPLAAWQLTHAQPDPLRARIEQVFAFDQARPGKLPAHQVRALSVAVAFGDRQGIRILLERLEPGMRR
jgi:hypothetical protein